MKMTAVFLNVVLFAITGSSVLTEGIPNATAFLIFTLLALLAPILNLTAHLAGGMTRQTGSRRDYRFLAEVLNGIAVICNLGLAAFAVWASVAQYPYREGNSVIPFALLLIITPIVSLTVIIRSGKAVKQVYNSRIVP